MEPQLIGGLVTAILGAIPAIIGAYALLRKAMAPQAKARAALSSLWDWLEYTGYQKEVPNRIRRVTLEVLESDEDDDTRSDQKE